MDYARLAIEEREEEKQKKYQEFIDRMKKADNIDSYSYPTCEREWHIEADFILCEFLEYLGYKELVDAFYDIPKWYA